MYKEWIYNRLFNHMVIFVVNPGNWGTHIRQSFYKKLSQSTFIYFKFNSVGVTNMNLLSYIFLNVYMFFLGITAYSIVMLFFIGIFYKIDYFFTYKFISIYDKGYALYF